MKTVEFELTQQERNNVMYATCVGRAKLIEQVWQAVADAHNVKRDSLQPHVDNPYKFTGIQNEPTPTDNQA